MKQWPTMRLGEVAPVVRRPVRVDRNARYREIGARSFGKGLFAKPDFDGAAATWEKPVRIERGDLVFSNIKAWEGAIAWATKEHDGCIASHRYITCVPRPDLALPEFLARYLLSSDGLAQVGHASRGSADRNRTLSLVALGSVTVPVPPLPYQRALVARLDALAEKTRQVSEHLDAVEAEAERLLAVRFREAIRDAPDRTMATVAPLVRREEDIDLEGGYPELGIRSFGKGTFHKPRLAGAEVGTKRLFRIEPGDLLFSNVFAWEGAIAIAQHADAGRYGSHRFMSCVADENITSAEFLRYYFLTEAGLGKIREASPGGAGRNRTLGVEKLLAIEVPIPSLDVQRGFNVLQDRIAELKAKHAAIREANQALLPATLERVFASAG